MSKSPRTKFHDNPSNKLSYFTKNQECQPRGGTRGKVRDIKVRIIHLLGTMNVKNFMPIHSIILESQDQISGPSLAASIAEA